MQPDIKSTKELTNMSALLKKIGNKLKNLAATINGEDVEETTAPRYVPNPAGRPETESGSISLPAPKPEPEPKPEPTKEPERKPSKRELFDNAIDKRNIAINAVLGSLKKATGTDSKLMREFYVFAIVPSEDFDVEEFAWADETMEEQLRRALDDAMLENIGKDRLKVNLVTRHQLPSEAKEIIHETLYYSFRKAVQQSKNALAKITVIEGTGSLMREEYLLDTAKKATYFIGRGPMANKPGAIRPNDIVIRTDDPNPELQARNNHVSSAHAEISAINGEFYFRALPWGCAATRGASSKLIFDSAEHTIMDTHMKHRLKDGYIIKLGKEVCLLFNKLSD